MKRPALTLLALALLAAPALAQGTPSAPGEPATASIGTDVVLVRVAGPWEKDGQKGFSRIIGRAAGGMVVLSVDWVSDAGTVVETMPIEVPDGADQLPLSRIRGESGEEDSAVYFDTPADETFVLIVGEPGNARFGPATN